MLQAIHEDECMLVGFYDLLSLHSTALTEFLVR